MTIKEKLLEMFSGDKPESTISGKIDSCKCGIATEEQTKVLFEILNIKNLQEQFRRFSHFVADNFDDRPELERCILNVVADRITSIQQDVNRLPLIRFNSEKLGHLADCIRKAASLLEADNGNQA